MDSHPRKFNDRMRWGKGVDRFAVELDVVTNAVRESSMIVSTVELETDCTWWAGALYVNDYIFTL